MHSDCEGCPYYDSCLNKVCIREDRHELDSIVTINVTAHKIIEVPYFRLYHTLSDVNTRSIDSYLIKTAEIKDIVKIVEIINNSYLDFGFIFIIKSNIMSKDYDISASAFCGRIKCKLSIL